MSFRKQIYKDFLSKVFTSKRVKKPDMVSSKSDVILFVLSSKYWRYMNECLDYKKKLATHLFILSLKHITNIY